MNEMKKRFTLRNISYSWHALLVFRWLNLFQRLYECTAPPSTPSWLLTSTAYTYQMPLNLCRVTWYRVILLSFRHCVIRQFWLRTIDAERFDANSDEGALPRSCVCHCVEYFILEAYCTQCTIPGGNLGALDWGHLGDNTRVTFGPLTFHSPPLLLPSLTWPTFVTFPVLSWLSSRSSSSFVLLSRRLWVLIVLFNLSADRRWFLRYCRLFLIELNAVVDLVGDYQLPGPVGRVQVGFQLHPAGLQPLGDHCSCSITLCW